MVVTQRIPLEQYSYIEFSKEYDSIEDALVDHALIIANNTEQGLSEKDWAKVRNHMFQTGEADPNITGLSKAQRYFINQAKLAFRALKAEDPIIN